MIKVGGSTTPEYEAFKPIDEQMDFHERLRLLYVVHPRAGPPRRLPPPQGARLPDDRRKWTSAELAAASSAPHQLPLQRGR